MRIGKASILLLVVILLPADPGYSQYPGQFNGMISGRILYQNGEFSCDECVIDLLMSGLRPVAATYADLAGRFNFRHLQRGAYVLKMVIPGFEEVRQEVEVGHGNGYETNVTIILNRKPIIIKAPADHVVDASEFADRFPKKAVEAFKRGLESKSKNKNDEALKHFEEAVRIAPDFYLARNELGLAYKQAHRFDEAEQEFLRAQELNQSSADPLVNLSSLYIDEGKPDRAVTVGEQAVKKNSRSAPAFYNLGMALYKLSMLDRAEKALTKALELAPKMGSVRLMLANVYLRLRNRDKLLEQLDSYLAENPNGDMRRDVEDMRDKLLTATP